MSGNVQRLPNRDAALKALYDDLAATFDKDLVERRGYRSPEWLKAALEPPAEARCP